MRTRTVAALVLMLALASAGCARNASDDPKVASAQNGEVKPSSSPSTSASFDPDGALKYARCMREQGLTWFPDPQAGKMSVRVPANVDQSKMDAAHQACKKFMPDLGEKKHQPSAEDIELARQRAKCMRENGIPNFPDPQPDGSIAINPEKLGTGPGDPTWDKAEKACDKYRPEGASSEKHVEGSGPGTGAKA